MARPLTTRETFAAVLARLVHERCNHSPRGKVSRTSLQSSVPVHERPAVRRGIDALIEHGIVGLNTDELAMTDQGDIFVAYLRRAEQRTATIRVPDRADPALQSLFVKLQHDERLDPDQPLEDIRTLPGRLENLRAQRQPAFWRHAAWILLLLVIVVAIVKLR